MEHSSAKKKEIIQYGKHYKLQLKNKIIKMTNTTHIHLSNASQSMLGKEK